jgi:hypothetical protein
LGFTNPPVGEALSADHRKQIVLALGIGDL